MIREKLMKRLEKKGKKLNPIEKQAKTDVIHELRKQASDMMNDKVKGLKKVTVAAPSEEGLKKGLEVADKIIKGGLPGMHAGSKPEEVMGEAEEELGEDLNKDQEIGECSEEEGESIEESSEDETEVEAMSDEDIDAEIKKLQEMKSKKAAK